MNIEKIKKVISIFLLIFTFASFYGCEKGKNDISNEVKFSDFKVSGCKSSYDNGSMKSTTQNAIVHDTIYAKGIDNNTLKVWTTNTLFSCCASEIKQNVVIENTTIVVNILQSEDGAKCNCVCGYGIEFLLSDLEKGQKYFVIIKKDIFDYYSFDLTFSKETNLIFKF